MELGVCRANESALKFHNRTIVTFLTLNFGAFLFAFTRYLLYGGDDLGRRPIPRFGFYGQCRGRSWKEGLRGQFFLSRA